MGREAGQIQSAARLVLTPPFRFLWRVTTEGLEHVPDGGGAIIAPNHISVLDSFFVPLVLPRRITYVGKAEYLDDWKTRWLFPAMGMIPIDRSGGDSSARALDAAAGVLGAGELFGIYPEGTRARDGLLHKGHTGMARLALRTGAPIVPVGIIGTDRVQPPDARLPAPFRRVHVRFGRPVRVERYRGRADDRMVLRQITDEVMYEIAALSGQEYVDTYASGPRPVPAESAPSTAPRPRPSEGEPSEAVPVPAVAGNGHASGRAAERVLVASAAAGPSAGRATGSDGDGPVDLAGRRSSASVLRVTPLDLDLELDRTPA